MKRKFFIMLMGLGLVLGAAQAPAQIKKGKTHPLQTKSWMRGVNGPVCTNLKELLKDPGPVDDKSWELAAQHAEVLNESSYVLMDDGRCPDAAWADGAKQLREGSAAVLKAVEAKDAAGARAAFGDMVKGCGTCHGAHKKKS